NRIKLAQRHKPKGLEIITDLNASRGIPLRDFLRVRKLVRDLERFDQAFFYPSMNLSCKPTQSADLRAFADVDDLCHGFADAFQETLYSIRLHTVYRKLSNDALLVFRKHW